MAKWVNDYVDGCNRSTKIFPSKPMGLLQPNTIPEGPWQSITCDLIIVTTILSFPLLQFLLTLLTINAPALLSLFFHHGLS